MFCKRRRGFFFEAAGFTLMELTLVTAIILTLLGLSTPIFRKTFSSLIVKDTAFTLSKMVNYAQAKAVMERRPYRIIFYFGAGRYQLFEWDGASSPPDYKKPRGRYGRPFYLSRGLTFCEPARGSGGSETGGYEKPVLFYPDGRCDDFALEIVDQRGNGYRITSKGFGGFISMEEITDEK